MTRLREANGVVLGKTRMHELAYGITTINPDNGTVLNPYNNLMHCGGSSGGTAAIVAARGVPSSSPTLLHFYHLVPALESVQILGVNVAEASGLQTMYCNREHWHWKHLACRGFIGTESVGTGRSWPTEAAFASCATKACSSHVSAAPEASMETE